MQGSSHEKFGVFLYSGPSPRVQFDSQTTSIILKRFFFFGGGGGMSGILRIGFASALHCKKLDHSTETQAREVGLWQFFSVVSDFRAN